MKKCNHIGPFGATDLCGQRRGIIYGCRTCGHNESTILWHYAQKLERKIKKLERTIERMKKKPSA